MDEAATITFRRGKRYFGAWRGLKVLLDGNEALSLRHGAEASIEVQPGEHTVQTKMDWCSSNVMSIECAPGQAVVVDCDSQPVPLAPLFCFIAPGRVFRVAFGSRESPPPGGSMVGAIVVGLVALAFASAAISAFLTHDEEHLRPLREIGFILAVLIFVVPSAGRPCSERTRLLELGWVMFATIAIAFGVSLFFTPFDALLRNPWRYVFLAVALGMIVWGHSLPMGTEKSSET